jgi:ABC-type nitrate/sulfonate/bicarbonate transport system substrate-binding protein
MTTMKNKKPLFIGLFIIIAIVIAFFPFNGEKQDNEITIGYSALRISLPVFVAQEKGFFADEGLNINLERFDTAQPLMSSLVAGNIPIAGYTALPITYNAMLRSETELYFVTSMLEDQQHRISYLIVPTDTSQDFSISDLKGKKIGILPTVAYKAWIEEILRKNNVDLSEVEIVQIAPALSPSALESKQVDALFTNDPAATTVLQQKIGRLLSREVEVPKYLGEPFLFGSFNIRKDFADANPEITKKVISAMNKAVKFVNSNPTEAKEMMKKYLHESQQPFVDFYPDALYQPTTETSDKKFQDVADQYLDIGIIPSELQVGGLIK